MYYVLLYMMHILHTTVASKVTFNTGHAPFCDILRFTSGAENFSGTVNLSCIYTSCVSIVSYHTVAILNLKKCFSHIHDILPHT